VSRKTYRSFLKLDSQTTIFKPKQLSNLKIRIFSRVNKSFDQEKCTDVNEISLEHKTNNKNQKKNAKTPPTTIGFIRRKSCNCHQCGNQTKFEKKQSLLPTKIRFHLINQEKNKPVKKPNKMKIVQNLISFKRNSFVKYFPKKLCINYFIKKINQFLFLAWKVKTEKSFTEFPAVETVSSLNSLDNHLNLNQNKSNSTLNSPTTCFLASGQKNKRKEENVFHHRNSTMGFFYAIKSDKSTSTFSSFKTGFMNTVTSNRNKSNDEKILEENDSKPLSFGKEIPSKSDKMNQIKKMLNNKELKKKEIDLCKLLKKEFDSGEQNYLPNISNMKINCSDANSSQSNYLSNKKNNNNKSGSKPNINNQIFFSASRLHQKRTVFDNPYTAPQDEYFLLRSHKINNSSVKEKKVIF